MTFENIKDRIAGRKIELTQGYYAIIDKDDYKRVSKLSWWYDKFAGARATTYENGAKNPNRMSLSRFIMNAKKGEIVDHINHNKLDNRKSNLRICNQSDNCGNRIKNRFATLSKYKGVRPDRLNRKWRASITKNGIRKNLGVYKTEKEAAIAYNNAARMFFGEFASFNIIKKQT